MPAPIIMTRGIVNGVEQIDSYGTIQDLKLVVYGTASTVLFSVLVWIAKEYWESRKKKEDKSSEKLDLLVSTITRIETRMEHIEKTMVPHKEIIEIVRDQLEFIERAR